MRGPPRTRVLAKSLRAELSPPELRLWLRLRAFPGVRFRRQHPMGPYVLDFYCAKAKLAVEIDGYSHAMGDRGERDDRRDAWLATQGVRTLRIPASEVLKDPDAIADSLCRMALDGPPQSP
jgi:very-short-patch-repair endonuclease